MNPFVVIKVNITFNILPLKHFTPQGGQGGIEQNTPLHSDLQSFDDLIVRS